MKKGSQNTAMSISINSFGGPVVWLLRKRFSEYTSRVMLSFMGRRAKKTIESYIAWFYNVYEKTGSAPLFLHCLIETIDRCNGSCEFCPANRRDEKRPYKRMTDEMYRRIVDELAELDFSGTLTLCLNNEPFLDVRIGGFAKYARERLPKATIALITNGTLLTPAKLAELSGSVDTIIVNDYGNTYRLSPEHRALYDAVRREPRRFAGMSVTINRRFRSEILATRAGFAPNKHKKNVSINDPCIYPFTDLTVYPDGKVGMCGNDCFETTEFGDVSKESLLEIWNSEQFRELRAAMRNGRDNYPFCVECDVMDAGGREKMIRGFFRKNS